MQMLGITLSNHNNEICYICMLRQSIFIPVYYYLACWLYLRTTLMLRTQQSHSPKTHMSGQMAHDLDFALRFQRSYFRSRNSNSPSLYVEIKTQEKEKENGAKCYAPPWQLYIGVCCKWWSFILFRRTMGKTCIILIGYHVKSVTWWLLIALKHYMYRLSCSTSCEYKSVVITCTSHNCCY